MKKSDFLKLALFGIKAIIFKEKKPILGTIILTDYCNLHCKHCAVNNINKVMNPYENIIEEMKNSYDEGMPIFNLQCALDEYLKNNWERPCHQCMEKVNNYSYDFSYNMLKSNIKESFHYAIWNVFS
ncbi:hypothetical protein CLLI_21730 [Clostridium liquoris]|jgi:uncharacterized radical SAM superfamily protein|uniref:Uncharacterized protein n=1 Tax=Clostridium liquoris TaxID=1289519 RepID=A0A2T0B1S6_9CLOT|nr:hypothetical protein [Clostridium liquoris]PRR77785.1 hypothetical protein CLLI_21730 [Clostridium liquoris]